MRNKKVSAFVRVAILSAVILLLGFTSLGYLKLNPVVVVTLVNIPVIIGAIIIGPAAGAFLGLVFGLTSLAQCLMGDVLGTLLIGVSPLRTVIVCLIPRVLAGWLCALAFRAMSVHGRKKLHYALAAALGSLLNTALFVGALFALFGGEASFLGLLGTSEVTLGVITAFIGINGVLELVLCVAVGFAIERIDRAVRKNSPEPQE